MRKGPWAACVAAIAAIAALAGAGPAQAGSYDVVSCGAPGAGGVNHAWRALAFDDRFWNVTPRCPALSVTSEPSPGNATRIPNWEGAGFELVAPPGALLDHVTIWRYGYRFNSTGDPQNTWQVQGYNGDSTVIGGPFAGETCLLTTSIPNCSFGAATAMSPASRADRDLETQRIFYSAACFDPPGCLSARDTDGFPFAGLSIYGSVVTVRDDAPPAVIARGPLLAGGWQTTDTPLSFGAGDAVGIRLLRVLTDGREVRTVKPACDFTAMVPCGQAPERSVSLGDDLPDGHRTLRVEATDTAGNVAASDGELDVDRHAPDVAFVPARGGRTVAVDVADAGSGVTGGTIEVRRRHVFAPLPTTLQGGRLAARMDRGTRTGKTLRVTAVDAVGHEAQLVGAPVRLRAGFGRRYRSSVRGSIRRATLLYGRLRATDGAPLAGREITITARLRVDGAAPTVAARVTTGDRGAFHVRLPSGASRTVWVDSPGTGGLQAARRALYLGVPWSSSLHIRPQRTRPGGTIHISGRLSLGGAALPASGKLVEVQAFDRGRWRVFATTRARGPRAGWRASYRFGARGRGSYRIRARIRREGTLPFELGYSRPVTVHVG